MKSYLTNQREAASISTTHRHHFFPYPRPVSPFFISPACFFTARSHDASNAEAGQRISGIKEETSASILFGSPSLSARLLFSTGFVGSADRRLSAKTRSMERTLSGSNAELGSL